MNVVSEFVGHGSLKLYRIELTDRNGQQHFCPLLFGCEMDQNLFKCIEITKMCAVPANRSWVQIRSKTSNGFVEPQLTLNVYVEC